MRTNDKRDPSILLNIIPMRGHFQFLWVSFLTPASLLPSRLPFMCIANSNGSAKKSFTATPLLSQAAPSKVPRKRFLHQFHLTLNIFKTKEEKSCVLKGYRIENFHFSFFRRIHDYGRTPMTPSNRMLLIQVKALGTSKFL